MRRTWRRANLKWALGLFERLHHQRQLFQHGVAETGADLSRVHKFLVLVVVADQQRSRIASPFALPFEPASDDELLAIVILDLEPRTAAPARLVARVQLLGHDAFEPGLGARFKHRFS